MKPTSRLPIFAVLTLGINSIVAQIILTREMLVVFYGNEISIGIILGIWLLMGGLGALIFGRLSDKIKSKTVFFILTSLALNLCLIFSLIFIRSIKPLFNILPGEIISLTVMLYSALIALAPVCLIAGFLFTLGCSILDTEKKGGIERIGNVYALEALGAAFGGIACNFILIKIFSSFAITLLLFIFNLTVALCVKSGVFLKSALVVLLACAVIVMISGITEKIDTDLQSIGWKGFNLIENKNSIYGNISVTEQNNSYSFFNNGLLMFTVPDVLSQEEAVHYSMLQNPAAGHILLIGGGSGGMLSEVLKYPVKSIDYVELDPMVIRLSKKYLKDSAYFLLDNPKVNVINMDGRLYVKQAKTKYDVIIMSLPDPFTAQLNRFYTLEFFKMVAGHLKDGGIFCFGLTASENYIGREGEIFLASMYRTLKQIFPEVGVIPGDTAYFISSAKENALTFDSRELTDRLKENAIHTQFVREYYLDSKLSKERLEYIMTMVNSHPHSGLNTDFSPISYYYDTVLWTTYFTALGERVKFIFKNADKKSVYRFALAACGALLAIGSMGRRGTRTKKSILITMATTGFSEISFEIIIIIAFQVLYGYLYYKLGIIVMSFMIGLSLGAFLITKKICLMRRPYNDFIFIQLLICIYPLVLPAVFYLFHSIKSGTMDFLGSNIVFLALPVIAGFIGGLQFPVANKLYAAETNVSSRIAGLNYGADMIGSCIGALLISVFIIPIIGLMMSCILLSFLNISSLLLLILNKPGPIK